MRFTILTVGTRGDLIPYLALGLGLVGVGHEVIVATYPDFEEEVRGRGLCFYPLSGGVQEVLGGANGGVGGPAGGPVGMPIGRLGVEEAGNNPLRLTGHLREVLKLPRAYRLKYRLSLFQTVSKVFSETERWLDDTRPSPTSPLATKSRLGPTSRFRYERCRSPPGNQNAPG